MDEAVIPPVDDAQLDDLRRRLRGTRLVACVPGEPWQRGTDATFLADLLRHWETSYDWRRAEERIRALPWRRTSDGVVAVDQRAADPDAPVVVLLHGWPDSVLRFERVLPLLTDLNVVVPCLPGYPWSGRAGDGAPAMARLLADGVAELGHERYVVSGGDIGSQVAEAWVRAFPDRVAALHLTDVPWRHVFALDDATMTAPERQFRDRMQQWRETEASYAAQHSTKPNSLSVALGDSPAGQAAWIVEKLRSWSDTTSGDLLSVFSFDDLCTWLSAYWFTGTIGTSFAAYALRPDPVSEPVPVPTAVTAFPHEPLLGPRELAERLFDVRAWDDAPAGGHFAAWEQPEAFAAGVRTAVGLS